MNLQTFPNLIQLRLVCCKMAFYQWFFHDRAVDILTVRFSVNRKDLALDVGRVGAVGAPENSFPRVSSIWGAGALRGSQVS